MDLMGKFTEYITKIKEYLKEYYEDIRSISKAGIKMFFSKRKVSLGISLLFLFMLGGYLIGDSTNSQDKVYKKLEMTLKKGKESALRDIVRVNNKKVEKHRLDPLINYYKGNDEKVSLLMKELKDDGKSTHMDIKCEKGLLGDNYYVELKVYNLRVDSNYKEGIIYINENEQILSGETLRGLVPGVYNIKGVIDSEFGQIVETQDVVVERDAITSLNYKASDVTINSEFKDAEVFINGNKTDYIVEEFKNIGPIPQDGSVKIHIEKELPWGRMKSESYEIKDISNVKIDMNIANEILISDVTLVVSNFYESVFSALNEEKKELITDATANAINKVYDVLEKKYFILKNKYKIESIDLKEDNSVYSFDGQKYRATIVADVNYEVSKALFGLAKEKKNKKFFTKLVYNDGQWTVENVENFSL